jgi:HlyD family secretion protein
MNRYLVSGLLAAVVVVLVWLLWPGGGDSDAAQVDLTTIERGNITQIVSAVGSVRALNTVEVGSQLSGQIDQLFADFNTPVQAGDLLARLDPQTFERRVQEAEANLAVARANVEIQTASIQKANAAFTNAQREFARQQALVERGSISASALDLAEAAFLSATADIEIARAQKVNAEATVLQREAALEAARIDLERTEIRSPINGVVIRRAVDQGQTVAASLQAPVLFTIAQDLTEIRIEASVDEADIGSVREGAEARFGVDAFPGQEFSGRVGQVRLAPNEEQNVVTYTVVIDARNPGQRLLPGMTASIDIVTGQQDDVLRVDNAAVRFRPPENLITASTAAPGPGGGPGGGRQGGGELLQTLAEMGVDEATRERVQTDLREAFGALRGMMQGGADRDAMRERMEGMSREVLTRHLSSEQMEQFAALQLARQHTRMATLYTRNNQGQFVPRRVRLGISDDRYTEIVDGELGEGDQVVTRLRRVSRS